MSKIFKPRRGTENTMKTVKSNTVLAAGELFAELPNTGPGTGKGRLVMGDGVTAYGNLPSFVENTDVSTAQVTVTADNSATSTAAINNVSSGATTGALIGSLKQAISLTKSELTNTIDEVYQAALAAGSGGIRWNASNNYIQLRSTEGTDNWIDWRYHNPNISVTAMKNDGIGSEAHTSTYICPFEGIYICMVAAYDIAGSTTCDNGTVIRSKQQAGCRMSVIYANVGATITMSSTASSGVYGLHSYYYLSGFKTALTDFETSAGRSTSATYTKSWSNNAANVMCACSATSGGFTNISSSFEGNISANFNRPRYNSFVAVPDSSYCSYSVTASSYHIGGVAYITLE